MAEKAFEIERRLIREFFSTNVFHIPDFQRDYKWGEDKAAKIIKEDEDVEEDEGDEFRQFLADLKTSCESTHDTEYYIGTVISHEEDKNKLQLIDGQQRVTSIVLILASYIMFLKETKADDDQIAEYRGIIKKFYDGKKDTKILSTSDPYGEKFLKELFKKFEMPEFSKEVEIENTKNHRDTVLQCLAFFRVKRPKGYNLDFIKYILDSVVVAHVDATNFRQAFVVFERMNDRGRDLTVPDKIKYFLMKHYSYDATAFINNSSNISELWRPIADRFESDGKFTQFLLHYFAAEHFFIDDNNWYSAEKVISWFRTYCDDLESPESFLEDLDIKSQHYVNFLKGRDNRLDDSEDNIDLKYQNRFFSSVKQTMPILLAASNLSITKFKLVSETVTKLILLMSVTKEPWQGIRTGDLMSIQSYILKIRKGDIDGFVSEFKDFAEDKAKNFQVDIVKEDFFGEKSGNIDLRKFLMILIENKIAGESGSNETYFYDDTTGKIKKETSTQNKTAEHILPKNDEPNALSRSKPPRYYIDSKDKIFTEDEVKSLDLDSLKEVALSDKDMMALIGRLGNFVTLDRVTNSILGDMTVAEKYKTQGYQNSTRTSALMVRNYITTDPPSAKHKKVINKYGFEKIELTKIGDEEYFLEEQIIKREKIILNILSDYLGVKLSHPSDK